MCEVDSNKSSLSLGLVNWQSVGVESVLEVSVGALLSGERNLPRPSHFRTRGQFIE
jgi:hypothetical protein